MKLNRFTINLCNRRHGLAAVLITTGLTASLFQNCSPAQFARKPAATIVAAIPNTPDTPPIEVPLDFNVTPDTLRFGLLPFVTLEGRETITLKKSDARQLNLDKIFFEGTDASFYSITDQGVDKPCEIQKNADYYVATILEEECRFKIVYKPLAGVSVKGTVLKLQTSTATKTVTLSGGRDSEPVVIDPPVVITPPPPADDRPWCFYRWGNESGWWDKSNRSNYINNLNIQANPGGDPAAPYRGYLHVGANGKKCMLPDINERLERHLTAGGYYDGEFIPKTWNLVIPPPPGSTTYTGTGKYTITCEARYFEGTIGPNGYDITPGRATYMVISADSCE